MPLSIKKDINTSLILPYFKLFVENFLTMPTHINIVSEIHALNQNNVNYLNEITSKKSSSDKTHLIYWEENNGLQIEPFNKNIIIPENTILSEKITYTDLWLLKTLQNTNNTSNFHRFTTTPLRKLLNNNQSLSNEFIQYITTSHMKFEGYPVKLNNFPIMKKNEKIIYQAICECNFTGASNNLTFNDYRFLQILYRLYSQE